VVGVGSRGDGDAALAAVDDRRCGSKMVELVAIERTGV
jgi:hypothetical protein